MIYRFSENKAVEFACEGVFLMGVDPYDQVPVTQTKLEQRDRLLIYTDGITERFNNKGKSYGKERMLQQLGADHADNPQGILDTIMEDVERFASGRPADDDQALLVGIID